MKILIVFIILLPFISRTQDVGAEFHYSVNHPLASESGRTFFGAGIGGNVLFRDSRILNLKLGLEGNFFHTWDQGVYSGKMSSMRNLHYQYVIVSVPAFMRLTFGERFKVFLEGGASIGGCVGGKVLYTYVSYGSSPGDPTTTTTKRNSYNIGITISPAVALGFTFPVSEQMDVFLKPEVALMKSRLEKLDGSYSGYGSGYGGSYDFNYRFIYVRLCAGIHLKASKND